MSSYIIKFENTSGESGTIIADAGFNYSDKLNVINESNIKISGSSETKRSLIEMGSKVYIYRNGTLEFKGLVDDLDFLEGGGISVHASGWEKWLALENGDYANSPWRNTASATIFNDILGECSQPNGDAFSAGTVETGTDIDFQAEVTDSLWNAISNLKDKTQQDIGIDYINQEIDILNHKGSSTSVATFNAGIQISNIRVSHSYPLGNDIRVYGKSEGETRIKSDTSHGQDATSKTTYGTIRKIVRDPTIITVAEANKLADALVAIYKNPVKIYDFEVLNPNQDLVSGDVITLNAKSQGLSNEEVRIVGIERGFSNDQEYLTLQVTNKEFSRLVKKKEEILAEIEKTFREAQTHDQFQSEYANANCATCIAGNSYICDNCWSFGGKLYYNGNVTCLCDIFSVCYGNQYLSFNAGMIVCSPAFQAGDHEGVTSCWSIFSHGIDMCGACIINAGTICANCFCGAGAGGGLWTDGTNPYIVPCNSCGLCVTGDSVFLNCLTASTYLYVCSGAYFIGGSINMCGNDLLFVDSLDGTCVCGSRKLRIPVGTNCY